MTNKGGLSKDKNVAEQLYYLHDKYVVVPVDKAPNDTTFVCKSHKKYYYLEILGIHNSLDNPTHTEDTYEKEYH